MEIKIKACDVPHKVKAAADKMAQTLTGKEITLDIESDYTVQKIKERLEEKEGIPPAQQRLIYGGKAMPDDKTASELKVTPGVTLHLILSLRGGVSLFTA